MKMVFPPAPPDFSVIELRRGNALHQPGDGTQAKRRRRDAFRVALEKWVRDGGCCDLLPPGAVDGSPVAHFGPFVKAAALRSTSPSVEESEDGVPCFGDACEDSGKPYTLTDDGYCYLSLVREDSRNKAVATLGFNPWKAAVSAWLLATGLANVGGCFRASLGHLPLTPGRYTQMHVATTGDEGALSWEEVLSLGPTTTRVGGGGVPGVEDDFAHLDPFLPDVTPDTAGTACEDQLPPFWPGNLPDRALYPSATFRGIREWIATLRDSLRLIVLKHIFNEDGNRTLSDWEYLRILPVQSLFDAYLSAPDLSQRSFRSMIVCTSAPGQVPHGPPSVDSSREPDWDRAVGGPTFEIAGANKSGYCYLHLVTDAHRLRFAAVLGRNPWGPTLAGALLAEPGIWMSGKFVLTVGKHHVTAEGPYYTQAHVQPSDHGCRVAELVLRFSGPLRVGMATSDLNALMNVQSELSVPSKTRAFDEHPVGASVILEVGVYGVVGTDKVKRPNIRWNVFSHPLLTAMFGIYESVRLESAKFVIEVDKGSQNAVWCAISPNTDGLKGDEWHSAPVKTCVQGSDQGAVRGSFDLPDDSPFATETRTRLPGNPPGTFNFAFVGGPEATGVISGRIRVRCAGQSVMGFFNIGGDGSTKSGAQRQLKAMRKDVEAVARSVGYPTKGTMPTLVVPDDSDSSDSDEDEQPAPQRSSPPRAAPVRVSAATRPN